MSQQARISLSTKDVIHIEGFQGTASIFKNDSTLRIRGILQQLQNAFAQSGMDVSEINALMDQGIPCEVLQPNAPDWQVGALRLSLDFQPGVVLASTLEVQRIVAHSIAAPVIAAPAAVVAAPIAVAVVPEMPEPAIDLRIDLNDDLDLDLNLGSDLELEPDDLSDDFSDGLSAELDSDLSAEQDNEFDDNDLIAGLDSSFGDDLGELSLEESGAKTLGEDAFDLSGFEAESDLGLENSLDLSGLGDLDGLGLIEDDVLSDSLSLSLDSQAVMTDNLTDLSNPWDSIGDLDDMMLQSSHS